MNPIEVIENKKPEDVTDDDLDFLKSIIRMLTRRLSELQEFHPLLKCCLGSFQAYDLALNRILVAFQQGDICSNLFLLVR